MKKIAFVLALALLMCLPAQADEVFDGAVYDAYSPVYDESFLNGWETISYIEPSGLLLSATRDDAEISVTVEEAEENPDSYLVSRVAGVTRYGRDISGGSVSQVTMAGFEKAARVSYSFRSLRDSGEGDVYHVLVYAAKIKTGYLATVSLTWWGENAYEDGFTSRFMPSFSLKKERISTTYTAFLTYCERRDDGIYLTLDFCDMEYEPTFGMAYALNQDDNTYTYKLSPEAKLWLPSFTGALYSFKRTEPDASEISIAIESFYNLNEVHAVYLVLFDENDLIVRLQHYNAL